MFFSVVLRCSDVPACNDDNVLVILMFLHVMMVMFCQCSDVPACSDDNVLAQCNRHFRCNIHISMSLSVLLLCSFASRPLRIFSARFEAKSFSGCS